MNPIFRQPAEAPSTNVVDLPSIPGTRMLALVGEQDGCAAQSVDSLELQPKRDLAVSNQRSPMPSDVAVGREIREFRRAQGRTQKEMARMVGVTGAQLHRYETGTTRIATSRLIAIADALDIRPDVLIAAGSVQGVPSRPALLHLSSVGDEIAELLQAFCTITDPKQRTALVAVARMMA